MSDSVTPISTDRPSVFAFRIHGPLDRHALAAMAAEVNEAFDRSEKVGMLLLLEQVDLADAGAGLSTEVVRADIRSLSSVDRYALVGLPRAAKRMIETLDPIIPVRARTFAPEELDQAWAFVGARPRAG